MTEFLTYQGKTAIALAVFYLFYRLLLSKETFHRFNRIVLLGTAALSFVLPLCVITIRKVVTLPYTPVADEPAETVLEMATTVTETASTPVWPAVVCGIFILGALAVLLMTVISIFKVKAIINSGEHQTLESGETLVITNDDTAPFSWMKYIVISREDYESGYSQILTHEKAHIALRHSWDLLFVDMITALQWFNPAIWMLKSDLRALHEFEADDAVLRSGANIKEYQYLLIRKAVSKSGYSVANSFNHSTLKARITMMLNKKSSRMSAWKALYVIPLVGISLAATAETMVDYQYEGQQPEAVADTPDGKDNKNSFREKNLSEGRFIIDEEASSITMIYFDHNGNELRSQHKGMPLGQDEYYFHNGNMATPAAYEKYLKEEGAVTFTTYRSNGKKILGIVTPNNNYVTGVWDATKHPDEQETVYHMKDKQYKVRGGKYVEIEATQKTEEKKTVSFHQVAQPPRFNGGDANEFSKWVNQNLRYPEKCRQSRVEGRVTLQFTVTEEGKVNNVKVLRSVNEDIDKEAVRVVSESPDWTPGKDENGETVPVTYTFPVIFRLPEATAEPAKSISIRSSDENGNDVEANAKDITFVVNGERMPEGFDLDTIPITEIKSINVDKTEEAQKEYDTDKGVIIITTDPKKEVVPFQHAAQKPTFNGGDANEFAKWVSENIKYPEKCRQSKIQGRVTLKFTVTETGKLADIRILRGVNEELDKEALRVISESPLWTPGKDENGEIIPISYVFPVLFQL